YFLDCYERFLADAATKFRAIRAGAVESSRAVR
ncbi:MAG: hypothetical protein JWN51_1479, partial [Phycisphaerales bacterium]|nr:hypothetical protein [Phycisphaerales bacterium]